MADTKISALPASTTPLAGTEVLPVVQSGATKQVSVANLTAGRAFNALSATLSSLTSGRVPYATTSGLLTDASTFQFDGTQLIVGVTSPLVAGAYASVGNTSGGNGGLAIGYGSGSGAFRLMYLISSNGSLYFESTTNAASLNSAGAWTNASDARLKNSITDIKYGLSAVMSAQPRSYKMNDLEGDYIGFVAQELQTVIPEVVSGDPEKQLGVDYGSLVAVAFKAIQEQQAIIESLKARLDAANL